MTNIKKTYFVTKHNDLASAMINLLTDRLDDTGWRLTQSLRTVTAVYTKLNCKRNVLSSTQLLHSSGSPGGTVYEHNGKSVTLAASLKLEQKYEQSVLSQHVTTAEHTYRQPGTAESVKFISSDSGVYLSATGTKQTHLMLSEYYSLANKPDTLYGAFEDGVLYGLEDVEDDYDDEEGSLA